MDPAISSWGSPIKQKSQDSQSKKEVNTAKVEEGKSKHGECDDSIEPVN